MNPYIPTYKDGLEFVLRNRKNASFRGMSDAEIVMELKSAAACGGLAYATDVDGSMTGIVTCSPDFDNKILFVFECLCLTKTAVLSLCCIFDRAYKGYTIQAIRDDSRDITHAFQYKNTDKLIRRLAALAARGLTSNSTSNP